MHIMCRKRLFLLLIFLGSCCAPALAQFNPKKQANRIDPVIDTVDVLDVKPPTELKLNIYSDAYDNYLKILRRRQRHTFSFQPAISLTQTSFTNWQPGGDNSFSGLGEVMFEHLYTAPVFSMKTVFDTKYGLMRTTGQTRKNIDYFDLGTTASWNISSRWKLSAALNWRSQYTKGYDYHKDDPKVWRSAFMAPGTINISGGFTYESADKSLNILLSPAAGKMTFVLNDSLSRKGGLGLDIDEKFKAELGMLTRVTYNQKFAKEKIQYYTKFESFWNYERVPTVNWEHRLTFKMTDLFSITAYARVIFDDEIVTPRVTDYLEKYPDAESISKWRYIQVYQTLGFTLSWKIASKPKKPIAESTIAKSRLKYNH